MGYGLTPPTRCVNGKAGWYDLHAVGQEGDEDMGLDPSLVVVEHRANRQVLLQSFLITLFPQPICQNEERSLAQA